MTYATKTMAMAILLAAVTVPAMAQRSVNSDRCEAKKLHKKARFYLCAARCGEHYDAISNPDGLSSCNDGCAKRRDDAITKLSGSWLCTFIPDPPDPLRCAAQVTMADSDRYNCQANCSRHSAEPQALKDCRAACDTGFGIDKDRIMASPICAHGMATYVP